MKAAPIALLLAGSLISALRRRARCQAHPGGGGTDDVRVSLTLTTGDKPVRLLKWQLPGSGRMPPVPGGA